MVFTQPYIEYDNIALKMAKSKRWYDIGLSHFELWSQDVGVPWQMIKPHLLDTINLARDIWPNQLAQLPMLTEHKAMLRDHWKALHKDFIIDS
ncbi:hypothetical protein BZG05_08265 [Salinivibrio kushneri]|nr:hypothetical protein BZG05_08265 [Salinivibrio kushneri]